VKLSLVLLGLAFLAPCRAPSQYLTDSTPLLSITPPPVADSAWRYIQQCSGLQPKPGLGLAQVHWFVADLIAHSKHHNLLGYWGAPDSASIIIDLRFVNDFTTVSHELLHYLRQVPGHPAKPFVSPCHLLDPEEADQ
jgi:hypothetical protein